VPQSAREVRELLEKREKERTSGKKDMWVPKIEVGTHVFRIGPPWKEGGHFWKDRLVHGGFKRKVYCAQNDIDKHTGKPRKCKVCRRWRKVQGDRSDFGSALWKLLLQKREGLWNVVFGKVKHYNGDTNVEVTELKEPKKFQVLQLSQGWTDELCEFFAEEDYREESKLGITDLKKGRWIRLIRKGEKLDTEYKFRVFKEASKISDSSSERHALEKSLVDLDRLVKGSSDEELESFIEDMERKAKKGASSSGSSSGSKSKSSSGSKSSDSKSKSKSSSSSSDAEEVLKEMKKSVSNKSKKKGGKSSDDKASKSKESKKKSSSGSKSKSKSESKSSESKSKSKSASKSASKSSSGSKSSSTE
jgi:hypothetical protein